ncbi:MAG: serine/threonine protein phosphatase [Aeropyrum sp.]|nr:serine/threonine protein phosphatase [Aeropyrum sp.]MCE4615803.1 serine/threonine protein phosphatase [Aeropyrum sp.]
MGNSADLPTPYQFSEALQNLKMRIERLESDLPWPESRVNGGVVEIELGGLTEVAIIGDIHGDYATLHKILDRIEALLESSGLAVFLGDYIDRGPPEGQAKVLWELARLATDYRGRVVTLRGNHEPPRGLEPVPHDYPYVLKHLYGARGEELYSLSRELFDVMPHAMILRGSALLLHGGPPTINLELLKKDPHSYLGYDRSIEVLVEILWNDPMESDSPRAYNPRGVGSLWGRPVTMAVTKSLGVGLIVRGHEPASLGYKLNHAGKVVTLFSRLGPPYHNVMAAYIECSIEELAEGRVEDCIRTIAG